VPVVTKLTLIKTALLLHYTQVRAQLPDTSTRIITVCQKGLRSLAACETLAKLGYQNLAWVNGGLETAKKGDIDTANGRDIR
jgi:rhodanese-related sulfurtransferase